MSFFKWGKSTDSPKTSKRRAGSLESDSNNSVQPSGLTTHSATSTLLQSDESDKMANPLDWNSTPTFIKKHFPHWKDSAPTTTTNTTTVTTTATQPIQTDVHYSKEPSSSLQRQSYKQPANTAMYSVLSSDTLTSIALKFRTTPSELCRLNKMATRTVIPGQILYVPELDSSPDDDDDSYKLTSSVEQPSGDSLSSSFVEEVAPTHIRIRAKYITTDQGCCKGSLLLTTASVMFKPSANDPLVLEHGQAPFGIIIPMKDIIYASVVQDFPKLLDASPKLQRSALSQRDQPTIATDGTTASSEEHTKQVPSKSPLFDSDSGCVAGATLEGNIDSNTEPSDDVASKGKPPVLRIFAPSIEDPESSPLPPTPGRVVRVFSDPQPKPPHCDSTDEMLAIMGAVDGHQDSNQDSTDMDPALHKLLLNPEMMSFKLYHSCNVDDDNSLGQDLNAPQFLKIRVALHAYHTFVPTVGMGVQKGEAKVYINRKTEFWFAFPSERTAELISFFMSTYSRAVDEGGMLHKWNDGVFVLIHEQTSSDSSGDAGLHENYYSNTSSSWEVYSLSDVPRERILKMEVEDNLPLPILSERSELMEPFHIQQLSKNLISAAVGHDWMLLYSTFKHGMSIQTLYRNMTEYGDNPVLLFIRDTTLQSFGAVLSCQLKISEHYYGTGESFLFKFKPNTAEAILELKVYQWSGENDFIVKGNPDSLVLGGGEDGQFGLWIDDQFYHGSSYMCKTFNNECLSSKADFICNGVEVWGFV